MHVLWDLRVTADLFVGGLGVGVFMVGALLYYVDSEVFANFIKRAFIAAPIAVLIGLVLLLTELGRPYNVLKAVTSLNFTSFMAIGIVLQSAFVIVSLLVAWRVITKGTESLVNKYVYLVAALAALVGFYHGFLLTGIGIEPWNNAIPVIFFVSSLLAGVSFLFLINLGQLESAYAKLKLPTVINLLLIFEIIAIFAWVYGLALNTSSSKHAYDVLMSSFGTQFWGFSILIGLIAPIVLFSLVLMKKVSFKSAFIPASIAMIVGSFFLKNLVVYLGQAV